MQIIVDDVKTFLGVTDVSSLIALLLIAVVVLLLVRR